MIISVNYTKDKKQYAFLSYYVFETTPQNFPKAAKNVKQIIIVNGMPFQIKSIFGLEESPNC